MATTTMKNKWSIILINTTTLVTVAVQCVCVTIMLVREIVKHYTIPLPAMQCHMMHPSVNVIVMLRIVDSVHYTCLHLACTE